MKIHQLTEAMATDTIPRPTSRDLNPEDEWEKVGANQSPPYDIYLSSMGTQHSLYAVKDEPVAKLYYNYATNRSPVRIDLGCEVIASKGIYASEPGYIRGLFDFVLKDRAILGDTTQSQGAIRFYKKLITSYPAAVYIQGGLVELDRKDYSFTYNGETKLLWDTELPWYTAQLLVAPTAIDLKRFIKG